MMAKGIGKGILITLLLGLSAQVHAFVMWDGHSDGPLHQYQVVFFEGTWHEANEHVGSLGVGWHLATITSEEEQGFLESQLYPKADSGKFWLGAWQDMDAPAHDEGWNWVTGEAWDYTNWGPIRPDNYQDNEHFLITTDRLAWAWDDVSEDMNGRLSTGYIAERSGDSVNVPEPGAMALLAGGLLALGVAGWNRRRIQPPEVC